MTMRYQVQNAKTTHTIPKGNYVMEPKFDGARIIAHIGEDEVTFYTRTDHKHSEEKLPHIAKELRRAFPLETWVDGELVHLNQDEHGTTYCDWGAVQSVLGSDKPQLEKAANLQYVIFDLTAMDDRDARSLPLKKRRQLLEQAFDQAPQQEGASGIKFAHIFLPPQVKASEAVHDALVTQGWEGSMVKDLDGPYRSGKRGYGWHKMKATADIDAVIMGFEPGNNSWEGYVGAIIFGQYDEDGNLRERGKCSGMTWAERVDMTDNQETYIGQVITVKHMGAMDSGKFRHPQFMRLRKDKPAEEVTWHNE